MDIGYDDESHVKINISGKTGVIKSKSLMMYTICMKIINTVV